MTKIPTRQISSGFLIFVAAFLIFWKSSLKSQPALERPTAAQVLQLSSKNLTYNEQNRRLFRLNRVCSDPTLYDNWLYKGNYSTNCYYSRFYNFSYCQVPKAGGTFWTQLFAVLESDNETEWSDFVTKARKDIHHNSHGFVVNFTSPEREHSKTVLISRDPYSRLYSAYIDKIYLPLKWPLAKNISRIYLVPGSDKSRSRFLSKCGNDVSFSDFLRYVIDNVTSGSTLDRHWAPIVSLIRPCDANYLMLVKIETFAKDIEYALSLLNVDARKIAFLQKLLHSHRAENSLPGIIDTVFRNQVSKQCLTRRAIKKRIWHSFQLQGFIDYSAEFPSEQDGSKDLAQSVLKTIQTFPLSSEKSKAQRQQALVDAYRNINDDIIKALQNIYYPDFKLFGYPLEPPHYSS